MTAKTARSLANAQRAADDAVREAQTPRPSAVPACPLCGGSTFLDDMAAVGHEARPAVVLFCSQCEYSKEVAL